MRIGLGTYAYFWRRSDRMPAPMSLHDMLEDTAALGGTVFQICDYPEIESWDRAALSDLRAHAETLGVELELGTRGIRREHLNPYLGLAELLGVSLIRTMQNTATDHPGPDEFDAELRQMLDELSDRGVTLALETYEQVATRVLVDEVQRLASPNVGVCLDVANVVARLETQESVIDLAAPHVVNLHIKDFRFRRSPGLIGFELTGAELGTGVLSLDYLMGAVRPDERDIGVIVEHWLPWLGDARKTADVEATWSTAALDRLKRQ